MQCSKCKGIIKNDEPYRKATIEIFGKDPELSKTEITYSHINTDCNSYDIGET